MIDFTKLRCYKAFTPLRVVNLAKNGQPTSRYKIVLGEKQKVGTFSFTDKGFVSNLNIKRKFRKSQTGVNALLTLYEFIVAKAKELNIDCLWFIGLKSNKNNVVRLYKRIASIFPEPDGHSTFMIAVNKKGQEVIDSFSRPVGLPENSAINDFVALTSQKLKNGQIL